MQIRLSAKPLDVPKYANQVVYQNCGHIETCASACTGVWGRTGLLCCCRAAVPPSDNYSGPSPQPGPQGMGRACPKLPLPCPWAPFQTTPAVSCAIFQGPPCLIQQSARLLTQLWGFSGSLDNDAKKKKDNSVSASTHAEVISSPLVWLRQFRAALQRVRASDSNKTEANDSALHSQQDEVMRMILTALLDHPQPAVQAAAAAACGEAVQVFPICGISFLPLLMYKLQSSVTHSQHGKPIQH